MRAQSTNTVEVDRRWALLRPNPIIGHRKNGSPIYGILGAAQNPVLEGLLRQRSEQEQFVEQLLGRVAEDGRDLVDAEVSNLNGARERIEQLDDQIRPLEEWETQRAAHVSAMPTPPARDDDGEQRGTGGQRGGDRLTVRDREVKYASTGHFLVDYIRSAGYPGVGLAPDRDAQQRVMAARAVGDGAFGEARAIQNQTTVQTPGLLPTPIIGQILTDLDASRPFMSSMGVKNLPKQDGKTFTRPKVTQHTTVGEQTAEKTELASRQYTVNGVTFTRRTFGGALNVSRQDIDWTSPEAWNSLVSDLQLEYGAVTEDQAAADFSTAITQTVQLTTTGLDDYIAALYSAAVIAATANSTRRATALRLPNHIWVSLDMWASVGTLISQQNAAQGATNNPPGQASPFNFMASLVNGGVTMAPGLASGTIIVGRSDLYEVYEERIGLLQAVEPKILGVEIAYGGYVAWGALDDTAFAKIVQPAYSSR